MRSFARRLGFRINRHEALGLGGWVRKARSEKDQDGHVARELNLGEHPMKYDALIEQYLAGPDLLRRARAGMTREQLLARPIPGKWSTLEVVCHIADYEPIYADRMKRVIALEEPELLQGDPGRFAAQLSYEQREPEQPASAISSRPWP